MIGHEAMDNGQHNTVLGLIARPKAQRSNSILMKIFYKGLGVQHHKGMRLCETYIFYITKTCDGSPYESIGLFGNMLYYQQYVSLW